MVDERDHLSVARVEQMLQSLQPCRPALDRDRLMFLAGQESVTNRSRRQWVWPVLTAVASSAALVLAALLVNAQGPTDIAPVIAQQEHADDGIQRVSEQVVLDETGLIDERQEEPRLSRPSSERRGMLALRLAVSEMGIDALPPPAETRARSWTPSVWDEIQALDRRENPVRPKLHEDGRATSAWGILSWGTNL